MLPFFATGPARVTRALQGFRRAKADLERAAAEIDEAVADKEYELLIIQTEIQALAASRLQAENATAALANLLGEA